MLSNFPETVSPGDYSSLLPEIINDDVVGVERMSHRVMKDWCEAIEVNFHPTENEVVEEYYEEHAHHLNFRYFYIFKVPWC